jgi:hypothetical protein
MRGSRAPYRRWLSQLPWVLAVLGLAIPMIGSGFIGWPLAVGWSVLLVALWWVRPLGGVDRFTRIGIGLAAIGMLVVLTFEGGLYLIPAAVAWLWISLATPEVQLASGLFDGSPPGNTLE